MAQLSHQKQKELAKKANVSKETIKRAKQVSKAGRSDEVISGEKSSIAIIKEEREKREKAEQELEAIKNKNNFMGHTTEKSQDFQNDDTLFGYYNAFFDPFASVDPRRNKDHRQH